MDQNGCLPYIIQDFAQREITKSKANYVRTPRKSTLHSNKHFKQATVYLLPLYNEAKEDLTNFVLFLHIQH